MPTPKTEASELSVAFGILGYENPTSFQTDTIREKFEESLYYDRYLSFVNEFKRTPEMYSRLIRAGLRLRENYLLLAKIEKLKWVGPEQQAATTSAAIDLRAANIPISVKNDSNVVLNPSPDNLFISLPSGRIPTSHTENWYHETAPRDIENLYQFAKEHTGLPLDTDFITFDKNATRGERKAIQQAIKQFDPITLADFTELYLAMCHKVAEESANIFNLNFRETLQSRTRSAVLESIMSRFFRLDAISYILTGIDRGEIFACEIPDLTSWKSKWKVLRVHASPDLQRRQSVVKIDVVVQEKLSRSQHQFQFHSEVRWSHGKFCGNPEAKLYKDFAWTDVPFFSPIV
jgi:hypothetical protein